MPEISKERDLLIAYAFLPFLTPNRTRLLLEYFEPLSAACRSSINALSALLSIDLTQAALVKEPLQDLASRERVAQARQNVVTLIDEGYPALLREIIDPPLVLWVDGRKELLATPCLSIVGSRRASPYAINVAQHLAAALSGHGVTIVSGLARGVDAAAHESVLEAQGATIGVLGTGIDVCYPRTNRKLFERMRTDGLIVTEFAPGTPPLASNFPMRNRVISGLAHGTVIVEATGRSGSLITARMAAEQGREVFAVPGSIFSNGSEGTHRLIQYGAKLVHDVNDVLEEIPELPRRDPASQTASLSAELQEVLSVFNRDDGVHVDSAADRLGRPVALLAESLLQLELAGCLRALPGARYIRVAK